MKARLLARHLTLLLILNLVLVALASKWIDFFSLGGAFLYVLVIFCINNCNIVINQFDSTHENTLICFVSVVEYFKSQISCTHVPDGRTKK